MNPLSTRLFPVLQRKARRHAAINRQRGTAAVEFAIVFPIFFMLFYGLVSYALIFLAQHSLTLAASEGARSALRFQPSTTQAAALSTRGVTACNTANNLTNWLPGAGSTNTSSVTCVVTTPPCSYDGTLVCMQITMTYAYQAHPLVPLLPMFSIAMPSTLSGTSVVQLNPINLTTS